jgi:hypothetical protein
MPEECSDCVCCWKTEGGRVNPRAGREIPWLVMFLLYGFPCTEAPICKNCLWARGKWKKGKAACLWREITKKFDYCNNYKWKYTREYDWIK